MKWIGDRIGDRDGVNKEQTWFGKLSWIKADMREHLMSLTWIIIVSLHVTCLEDWEAYFAVQNSKW